MQVRGIEAGRGQPAAAERTETRVSALAAGVAGSEILRIAGEIRELKARGERVCNLTVGDFDPAQFPIPPSLRERIEAALRQGETNYPPAAGMPVLRESIAAFYREWLGLDLAPDEVLVTAGVRPAIYAAYRVLVDSGDRVIFPVPSWNNTHYTALAGGEPVPVPCDAADSFLPTPMALEPVLRGARLLALNSPLNPAGTMLDADTLRAICESVVEENLRRPVHERPLYLLFDQVYWMLTFGTTPHHDPVSLCPEVAPYTVIVDGISKAFAATGLRVGWAAGPPDVIRAMSDLCGHVGAWAPRPEQVAAAGLLRAGDEVRAYRAAMTAAVRRRLDALHRGILAMRDRGLPVDALAPAGAIYLSARFALNGRRAPDGALLRSNEEVRGYLLRRAGFAAVPFQAFGVREESGWFRLSVGAVSFEEIAAVLARLEEAVAATMD
jgi:aspartate aminotransferase